MKKMFFALSLMLLSLFSNATDMKEISDLKKVKHEDLSVKQLEILIAHYSKAYWEKGESEISDKEYDKLVMLLKTKDPENKRFNEPKNQGAQVKHKKRMRSLEKSYTVDGIKNWLLKNNLNKSLILVQPKYDGIAVEFNMGVLSTRGDGETGIDISHVLKTCTILSINKNYFIGELIVKNKSLEHINKLLINSGEKPYKSARGLISALIKQKKLPITTKDITIINHDFYSKELIGEIIPSNLNSIFTDYTELDFPLDGVVLKIKDQIKRDELGSIQHHPKWAIAYKCSDESKKTKLIGIEWNITSNGFVPVGVLEPIEIGNATVRKIYLYNISFIKQNEIMINDYLEIKRKGKSTPIFVSRSFGENRQNPIIEECPFCSMKIEFNNNTAICINKKCYGTIGFSIFEKLKPIKGVGLKTILKLTKTMQITTIEDIVKIDKDKTKGAVSNDKLDAIIKKAKEVINSNL